MSCTPDSRLSPTPSSSSLSPSNESRFVPHSSLVGASSLMERHFGKLAGFGRGGKAETKADTKESRDASATAVEKSSTEDVNLEKESKETNAAVEDTKAANDGPSKSSEANSMMKDAREEQGLPNEGTDSEKGHAGSVKSDTNEGILGATIVFTPEPSPRTSPGTLPEFSPKVTPRDLPSTLPEPKFGASSFSNTLGEGSQSTDHYIGSVGDAAGATLGNVYDKPSGADAEQVNQPLAYENVGSSSMHIASSLDDRTTTEYEILDGISSKGSVVVEDLSHDDDDQESEEDAVKAADFVTEKVDEVSALAGKAADGKSNVEVQAMLRTLEESPISSLPTVASGSGGGHIDDLPTMLDMTDKPPPSAAPAVPTYASTPAKSIVSALTATPLVTPHAKSKSATGVERSEKTAFSTPTTSSLFYTPKTSNMTTPLNVSTHSADSPSSAKSKSSFSVMTKSMLSRMMGNDEDDSMDPNANADNIFDEASRSSSPKVNDDSLAPFHNLKKFWEVKSTYAWSNVTKAMLDRILSGEDAEANSVDGSNSNNSDNESVKSSRSKSSDNPAETTPNSRSDGTDELSSKKTVGNSSFDQIRNAMVSVMVLIWALTMKAATPVLGFCKCTFSLFMGYVVNMKGLSNGANGTSPQNDRDPEEQTSIKRDAPGDPGTSNIIASTGSDSSSVGPKSPLFQLPSESPSNPALEGPLSHEVADTALSSDAATAEQETSHQPETEKDLDSNTGNLADQSAKVVEAQVPTIFSIPITPVNIKMAFAIAFLSFCNGVLVTIGAVSYLGYLQTIQNQHVSAIHSEKAINEVNVPDEICFYTDVMSYESIPSLEAHLNIFDDEFLKFNEEIGETLLALLEEFSFVFEGEIKVADLLQNASISVDAMEFDPTSLTSGIDQNISCAVEENDGVMGEVSDESDVGIAEDPSKANGSSWMPSFAILTIGMSLLCASFSKRKKKLPPTPPTLNKGIWSKEEHEHFVRGWKKYGKDEMTKDDWENVAKFVPSRTTPQVKAHYRSWCAMGSPDKMKRSKKAESPTSDVDVTPKSCNRAPVVRFKMEPKGE